MMGTVQAFPVGGHVHGASVNNSLSECAMPAATPGTEAPSPFLAWLERVMPREQ
jgi:hypothetical protein